MSTYNYILESVYNTDMNNNKEKIQTLKDALSLRIQVIETTRTVKGISRYSEGKQAAYNEVIQYLEEELLK